MCGFILGEGIVPNRMASAFRKWMDELSAPILGEGLLNTIFGGFLGAWAGTFFGESSIHLANGKVASQLIEAALTIGFLICCARVSALGIVSRRPLIWLSVSLPPIFVAFGVLNYGDPDNKNAAGLAGMLLAWLLTYWLLAILSLLLRSRSA